MLVAAPGVKSSARGADRSGFLLRDRGAGGLAAALRSSPVKLVLDLNQLGIHLGGPRQFLGRLLPIHVIGENSILRNKQPIVAKEPQEGQQVLGVLGAGQSRMRSM